LVLANVALVHRHLGRDSGALYEEANVRRVGREFVEYYNRARPSQAIGGIPDPYPELQISPPREGKLVALPVLGRLEHDDRLVA
jgi:hypothetical protein